MSILTVLGIGPALLKFMEPTRNLDRDPYELWWSLEDIIDEEGRLTFVYAYHDYYDLIDFQKVIFATTNFIFDGTGVAMDKKAADFVALYDAV